jgi:hypothetical protein
LFLFSIGENKFTQNKFYFCNQKKNIFPFSFLTEIKIKIINLLILTFDIILFGALILLSSRAVKALLEAAAKVVTIAVGAKIFIDKKLEELIEVKSPKTQINIKNIRKLRKKPKVLTPKVICSMKKQHLTNQMINHFKKKI